MCCKPSTKAFAKVCQLIAEGVKSAPAIMYLAPLCGDRPAPSADLLPHLFFLLFSKAKMRIIRISCTWTGMRMHAVPHSVPASKGNLMDN
jgi:hypothetical protein